MSNHGRGKIRVEDDFVRFMNLLALHYTDELGARSSPEEFNRHMDNIAPSVIRSWFHYLKHEGDLTLQQAMLPSGDYATYKEIKMVCVSATTSLPVGFGETKGIGERVRARDQKLIVTALRKNFPTIKRLP